jgi:hypothetical protein
MRTKCNKCHKSFLSYDEGEVCPSCKVGVLRGRGKGKSNPVFAPPADSKLFKQRSTSR